MVGGDFRNKKWRSACFCCESNACKKSTAKQLSDSVGERLADGCAYWYNARNCDRSPSAKPVVLQWVREKRHTVFVINAVQWQWSWMGDLAYMRPLAKKTTALNNEYIHRSLVFLNGSSGLWCNPRAIGIPIFAPLITVSTNISTPHVKRLAWTPVWIRPHQTASNPYRVISIWCNTDQPGKETYCTTPARPAAIILPWMS